MISTLLLADAAADPMLAVVAVFAVLCGAVLLGGRSVIRIPIQVLRSFMPRQSRHEPLSYPSDQPPDSAHRIG
jgi:hypothetical protein